MSRFDGKVVLISGGARGMGETHCRGIVAEGGKVVISDVLDTEGQALADELGDNAIYTHLDVTKEDNWNSAVKLAVDTFGGLNVLINNAGIVNLLSESTSLVHSSVLRPLLPSSLRTRLRRS
jgi:3alpha(or 20beta)-hydroxysteroid dehydrogenase